MRRRDFLRSTTAAATAMTLPPELAVDPYAPVSAPSTRAPTRVGGRVHVEGRGVSGVAVTDGYSVAVTDQDGDYTLIADGLRPFVHISIPAGYRIPRAAHGTARFYQPLARGGSDMRADFALERLRVSDEHHGFFVLADPQTQDAYEMDRLHDETVPDVRGSVRAFGDVPTFGVACGDIMYDDLELYPRYEAAVREMGIPFFQVIGNHDLVFDARSDEGSASTFESHFGPTYYSFNRGAVHYVVLDDVFWHGQGYLGYIDERQQRWLVSGLRVLLHERGDLG